MTLSTQVPRAAESRVERVIGALAGVTARAGHHLTGSRIKDPFANGMGEDPVLSVASTADLIDGCLGHGRMIGAVGRMAVVAGPGQLVLEFG